MTSDPIFDLVHSLTKREKIFFRRYTGISGKKEPNYIKLFDVMEKMKEYDEAALDKKLKRLPFYKRLAFERNYLKNAILDCLRAGGGGDESRKGEYHLRLSNWRRELDYARILHERGISNLAFKIVRKVKQEAKKYESLHLWKSALFLEERMVYNTLKGEKGERQALDSVIDEQLKLSRATVEAYELTALHRQGFSIAETSAEAEKAQRLGELLKHPLLQPDYKPLTVKTTDLRLNILSNIYSYTQQYEKHYESISLRAKLFAAHPHLYDAEDRLLLVARLIRSCMGLGKIKESNEAVKQYFEISPLTDRGRQNHFAQSLIYVVPFWIKFQQYEEAIKLASDAYDFLGKGGGYLNGLTKHDVYHSYLQLFIITEKYDKALDWFHLQQQETVAPGTEGDFLRGQLCAIIAHFELGNSGVVTSMCRAIQRTLKDQPFLVNTERVFTRFIQKIPPLAEQQEHWEKFGTALSPIREGEEKLKFAYLDFAEWVESKIQKKPLRQIIEEKRRRIEKHG